MALRLLLLPLPIAILAACTGPFQGEAEADDGANNPAIQRLRIENLEDQVAALQATQDEQARALAEIRHTLENQFPLDSVDVRLEAAAVTGLFGSFSPTRVADRGRHNNAADYVSVTQALQLMAGRPVCACP